MRHRKSGRQLGRNTHHRRALFRSLVTSLLEHERIETTEAKAKEIRVLAEQMITLGKDGGLHARRQAAAYIRGKAVVSKLFQDLAGRFSERNGGYTRLIKTRHRIGDNAPMVVIELVTRLSDKKQETTGGIDEKKKSEGSAPSAGSQRTKESSAAAS